MLIAHMGLSRACLMFVGLVGLWSLYEGLRGQGPSGSLLGGMVICEVLLIAQVLVGVFLLANEGWTLPRPFLHFLYGAVAVISLPAMYGYLSKLAHPRALNFGFSVTCGFVFLALLRAMQVAD